MGGMDQLVLPTHPSTQLLQRSGPLHPHSIEQHLLQPELLVERRLVRVHYSSVEALPQKLAYVWATLTASRLI